jgi:hypothetical protein
MKERELSQAERRHDHACLLYKDQNELKRFLLPFLQEGLRNGEHCLYICPEDSVDDWSLEFQAYGIDVVACLESGRLVIATGDDWRRTPFKPLSKARELWEHIEAKLAEFPAIRIAGNASWAGIEPQVSSDMLCRWEATADLLYEGQPVRCICMYDLGLHSPSDLRAALRTHFEVVLDQRTLRNPYYEVPRILEHSPELFNSDADAATIEGMLARLRRLG